MFCTKCGKAIPDDSVFCPECGTSLAEKKASHAIEPASEGVSNGMKIGMIVGSIFIPLLGIIMGVLYMKDKDPAKQKAGKVWLWVGIVAGVVWLIGYGLEN